ncbi:HAD family hydrolase [Paenibacillus segetis]|uniref:Hydrolase n=1 Tax=Paenibacillus segetis TaxID=1325360 RepID=A0ABQ1YDR3_9BACL|nr:HAD family hydrolase [Paenibacillus segetis]GGH21644.1 hydrolase [Paenibacillus segetis]
MYNTFIYDVDGTLIDTELSIKKSLQKMLKVDYDRDIQMDQLDFVLGIPGTVALRQLGIHEMSIPMAEARWNYFVRDFKHSIKLFNGIQDVFNSISSREITQGLVTSRTYEEFNNDFVPFGLMSYLTHIVCADDTEKHKPNPEPLLKFMEKSGATPTSSIYIGDTIYDYECARDAGIDFGLALWGCKNHECIPAKYKFETPMEIINLL